MEPKVMFVDGPTGVGKGYFIDHFKELYESTYPSRTVSIIRAADVVLKAAATEERKYTQYQTPVDKLESIYLGHVQLLWDIAQQVESGVDLVIVDRSFMSFMNYNLYNEKVGVQVAYDQRYSEDYRTIFGQTPAVFVHLQLSAGMCLDDVVKRIQMRGDDKPIDVGWLESLYYRYKCCSCTSLRSQDNLSYQYCASSNYDEVFDRQFLCRID